MAGLLKGVKVVEMAVLLTGDYVGSLLGDEGAEVIKIESPPVGDYIRSYMGELKPNWSAAHLFVNRNKRSLSLNLRAPEGQEVLHRLLKDADVFVTGNVGETPRKLKVDYETLSKLKPDIIYCHATGFGTEGPLATLPSHGQMMDAIVGGTPTSQGKDGLLHLDKTQVTATSRATGGTFIGPIFAAFGVAAALVRRAKTGQGAYLDVSCSDSVLAAQWVMVNKDLNIDRIQASEVPSPGPDTADYNYYRAKDGKGIVFCAQEPRFWENFCKSVKRPDLLDAKKRIGNGIELRRVIQGILEKETQAYWTDLFVANNVAAGPVVDIKDVDKLPHTQARGIIQEYNHPVAGPFKMVTNPIKVRGEQFELKYQAPSVGQHTDEVLKELGYTPDQIASLRKKGAV